MGSTLNLALALETLEPQLCHTSLAVCMGDCRRGAGKSCCCCSHPTGRPGADEVHRGEGSQLTRPGARLEVVLGAAEGEQRGAPT
ncbi:UNVERIFIED_CONTAM: hypothetical protein K2H54_006165 [Gekko kuhli]